MVRTIDFYVLLKVAARGRQDWRQHGLADELRISSQSVNAALARGAEARLYSPQRRRVIGQHLREAIAAIRFFHPAKMEGPTIGVPTAWRAPAFTRTASEDQAVESTPVWPSSSGVVRGLELEPLHPMAPLTALEDEIFYRLLAATDLMRLGNARERELAMKSLRDTLEDA